MIDISKIEKAIAAQLNPLRIALEESDILVAALPKHSSAYSEEVTDAIKIIVSKASGVAITPFYGIQDIQYTITIFVSLALRYQDSPEEKNVLDWVCEQIFKLLYNFEIPGAKFGLSFLDYTPLKPENGQWLAQLQFSFLKEALPVEPASPAKMKVEFVQLFSSGATVGDNSLITQIPHP